MSNSAPIPAVPGNGIFLPELGLRLDPHKSCAFGFVSHAHADHFARHRRILCSRRTADLIAARYGRGQAEVTALDFGEEWEAGGHRIRLLPAGHILGSAMIHITRLRDGATLLYTGDFKTRTGLSAEAPQFAEADTLIMETTFGLPHYVFPPTDEVIASVVKFAREAIEDGDVPVLLGYSLGKAQEILSALADAGLPALLHKSVHEMTQIYRRFQPGNFPPMDVHEPGSDLAGKVLVYPPNAARSQIIRRIRNRRVAMLSGWGMNPGAKFRYQVDEVFPLSDHADYPGLLECVEKVNPRRVLTVHGSTAEFARDLRQRGIDAWSFFGDDQMELSLSLAPAVAEDDRPGEIALPRPGGGFTAFADTCERIAAATGRLRKTGHLADYLRALGDDDLPLAATFFTGRPRQKRSLATGYAIVRRALLEVSRIGEQRIRAISKTQNDSGRTAFLSLTEGAENLAPGPFALAEADAFFAQLAALRGPDAKVAHIADRLARLHPTDVQYLVKLLAGDLRIGLQEGLLEEGIAAAFDADPAEVREANMLLGDVGETALLARQRRLGAAGVRLLTPIKCMLASPEETAETVCARLSPPVWLEDKFDGIRAQLHRGRDEAGLFSRDLRPLAAEFPELIAAARTLGDDVVLDGEIIAFAEGKKLTFFDLQKRLGRRHESDLFLGPSIPVRYVVFDLLWLNGTSLLGAPLRDRRAQLESLALPPPFELAAVHSAADARAVDATFKAARRRRNEGLIAKDPASPYSSGRRGKAWLKLKKAWSTLDVVVTRAQQGHGKRSHVLSDYTFAVRDERTGALATIGKAYSGLTDAEIEQLTEHFESTTIETKRRVRTVEPDTVLEIAFDSIQPSQRHDSGLALRFPRIKAWRKDKTVDDIDTLAYARSLAGL